MKYDLNDMYYFAEVVERGGFAAAGRALGVPKSRLSAYAMKLAKTMRKDQSILVSLSGRGDKDIGTVADLSGVDFYTQPSARGVTVKGAVSK